MVQKTITDIHSFIQSKSHSVQVLGKQISTRDPELQESQILSARLCACVLSHV